MVTRTMTQQTPGAGVMMKLRMVKIQPRKMKPIQRVPKLPSMAERADAVREVTLTEKYTISSMPDPVYNTIKSIIEDGATLTREM